MENLITLMNQFNFNGADVRVVMIDKEVWFVLKDVCDVLDLAHRTVKQRLDDDVCSTYPIYDSLGRKQLATIVNEDGFYDVILDSRKPEAKKFRKWVTKEVLPSIRKNGGYINPNATEEQVDTLAKFSLPKLKATFTNETVERLMDTYMECRDYYKSHNSKERLMMLNRIEKALNDRVEVNKEKMSFPIVCIIDDVIKQIKDDKGKLNNKIRGGQKAQQTRKISKLEPSEEEYMVIDTHGFSANYMYEYVYSSYQDKYIAVASKAYKIWQNKFPACQVTRKEDLNVDWNKPITVFLKFDAVEKMDIQNLEKSILDQIFNRIYQIDDNCISKVVVSRNNTVDTYDEGKIYICIKN